MLSEEWEILDSGYLMAMGKRYQDAYGQWLVYYVYPHDTKWVSGHYCDLPKTETCKFAFSVVYTKKPREPRTIPPTYEIIHVVQEPCSFTCDFVSKFTGKTYTVVADRCDQVLRKTFTCEGSCEGVVCDDICVGADKYSQECATAGEDIGKCVFDELIEANHPDCPGYIPIPPDPIPPDPTPPIPPDPDPDPTPPIPPDPDPEPEPSKTPWAMLGAALIGLYLYLRR